MLYSTQVAIEVAGVAEAEAEAAAADLAEVASVEAPRVVVVPPVAGSRSSIPLRYELAPTTRSES